MDMKTRVGRKHSLQRGTSGKIGRDTIGIAMVIKILCDFSCDEDDIRINLLSRDICVRKSCALTIYSNLSNRTIMIWSMVMMMWIMINGDGNDDDDCDIGSVGRVKKQDNGSPLTRHSRSMKTIIN